MPQHSIDNELHFFLDAFTNDLLDETNFFELLEELKNSDEVIDESNINEVLTDEINSKL